MFCFLGPKAWGILAPQPGIKLTPPVLEGQVLTAGPPRESLFYIIFGFKKGVCMKKKVVVGVGVVVIVGALLILANKKKGN